MKNLDNITKNNVNDWFKGCKSTKFDDSMIMISKNSINVSKQSSLRQCNSFDSGTRLAREIQNEIIDGDTNDVLIIKNL